MMTVMRDDDLRIILAQQAKAIERLSEQLDEARAERRNLLQELTRIGRQASEERQQAIATIERLSERLRGAGLTTD